MPDRNCRFLASLGMTNQKPDVARNVSTKSFLHNHFALQYGCELAPERVSCCSFVPSASMVHIWSLPVRFD